MLTYLRDKLLDVHHRVLVVLQNKYFRTGVRCTYSKVWPVHTFAAFMASLVIEAILALEMGGLPSLRELSYRCKKQFTGT